MFNQNNVTKLNIPRSYKEIKPIVTTTFNTGDFVPFFNMEIIPNDKISLDIKTVTNMTTPNYATMDTLYQHIAFFYCPNRIVWTGWDKFYGEGKNADYETFVQKFVPQLKCPNGGWGEKTVADYLGVTTKKNCHDVSALPFRMVAMIYNEYYRDEQRMAKALISKGDNDQTGTNGNDYVNDLQNGGKVPKTCRLWDYFTGSKLEFQAGNPVVLPLGTSAPVIGNGKTINLKTEQDGIQYEYGLTVFNEEGFTGKDYLSYAPIGTTTTGPGNLRTGITYGLTEEPDRSGMVADLSQATAATIRDFKIALMSQQVAQNLENGGTRYIEQLYKRWGVYANELELEIPKFLGSKTTILNMNMVVGTAGKPNAESEYNFGDLGGMSNTYDEGNIFTYRFKQHGYLFGIVTIRPYNTYENGIPKQLVKNSIDDFYKPEMGYLGPDEIKNYEIYSDASDGKDDEMFGVRNYGDELRFIPNRVTGGMRSNATYSQAYKTYSINYSKRPLNNEEFIKQSEKQVDKTLTEESTTMDQFIFQAQLIIKMTRNIPKNPQAEQIIRL